ncbi:MAG: hypothetical protein QOE03_589 [Micromonosporaceae bacterium]|jgi:anti-anti-sigma factor|nr:hypothetical protein [Micromonosporaceae bacterium]
MSADHFGRVRPVPLGLVASPVDDGVVRLAVHGEVDVASADSLRDALTAVLGDRDVTRVEVDFAGVEFLDSTGISVLTVAYRLARTNQIQFVLVNCERRVLRVLEITGVDKLLTAGDVGR